MSVVPGKSKLVTMQGDRTDDESDRSEASHELEFDLVAATSFRANRKKRMARQRRVSIINPLPFGSLPTSNSHVLTLRSTPPAREIDARRLRYLLQKELRNSDVSSLGRMVLPKRAAEAYLPTLDVKEGIYINMDDMNGQRVWNFKYRFWPNNNSRMYVLENTGEFARTHGLQPGDFIMLYKDDQSQKYVIQARKYLDQDEFSDYTRNGFFGINTCNDRFVHDIEVNKSSYLPVNVATMDDLGMSLLGDNTFLDEFPLTFSDAQRFILPLHSKPPVVGRASMGGDSDSSKVNDSNVGTGVTVNIRCSNGSKFSVKTSLESTVGTFKALLAQNCDIPAEQQRLIFKGRILKDDQTLESYGLQEDQTVHMVRGFAPASSTNTTTGTANVGGGPNTTSGAGRGLGSNEGAGFGGGLGASLLPGLGVNGLGGNGASGLFGSGLPEFEQVQQQLTQNPNMMREIMNMPVIQNLMNNPDLMRNLIMSNPQMREIIDRNPDLAHILNDPSTLRQTLEAARNPELMREMMRNTDRAMSNIESSPEGFNMLRRMYETVQEPFLNATTMAGDTGNDVGSNPFAALLGNQGGGLARDRSTNPTTTGSETMTSSPAPNTNPLPNPWNTAGGGAQTNTTTRSNPAGEGRATGIAGLAGLGLPEMDRMFGGGQDASSLNQFLQNPSVSQTMQSLLSNPQYMNQILGLNPQLRNMLDSNSQLREMMQNPEFLRQMTSPETLQQVLSLQQSLMSHAGRQQSVQEPGQTGGGTGTPNNNGLELLMNMFGGLGAGSLSMPNTSDVPLEQLYATQLSQLQEMGFFDTQENIRALSATAGNVHAAVERLLGNLGQ
ncbi:hypothetical protein NE237_017101 [Protea cynaroides]|uniref:Uncharacterized protein n=1 Tax=Protea cynaroides TaxID=273540 RepID=A0A9Q0K7E8_9MAGN|nr:hypothetical protein NE237_017101 [Protea cynaroides]